jgi:hypothetical protein
MQRDSYIPDGGLTSLSFRRRQALRKVVREGGREGGTYTNLVDLSDIKPRGSTKS